jgi:hypothetical protein
MPRSLPTLAQIRAVRGVLYDPVVWRDIEGALESIDGTMNTRFAQRSHVTLVCPPGIPCAPAVEPNEGARYADVVAQLLFGLGRDVERIPHINTKDKADLVTGVDELAKSWQARAIAWRATAQGATDMTSLLNGISTPYRKSAKAFARVQEYLQ